MPALRFVAVLAAACVASGCLNSASLIKIKPDGSGTIEQTMMINTAALKGLLATMGATQGKEASSGVLNEEEFKRSGERMGVKPVSLTPVKDGSFEGAKAVYAFDDITKVRLEQDPQVAGPTGGRPMSSSTRNPIRFDFTRQAGNSVLTISVDEKAAAEATAKAQEAPSMDSIDPQMMQMIKTMFDGFHILIDVEVDGKIVKTNADYVNGSRVTLLELDMAGILEDEAKLKTLQSKVKPGASLTELRPYLKDIKGVKMNHPSVTIEYR